MPARSTARPAVMPTAASTPDPSAPSSRRSYRRWSTVKAFPTPVPFAARATKSARSRSISRRCSSTCATASSKEKTAGLGILTSPEAIAMKTMSFIFQSESRFRTAQRLGRLAESPLVHIKTATANAGSAGSPALRVAGPRSAISAPCLPRPSANGSRNARKREAQRRILNGN